MVPVGQVRVRPKYDNVEPAVLRQALVCTLQSEGAEAAEALFEKVRAGGENTEEGGAEFGGACACVRSMV